MTRIGSLFSGAGGLDLAVEQVFGGDTVWQCEREEAPSMVLAKRFPGVPNLGDITAVDWSRVEPVDVLCGGFPCQDVSAAGRRAGIAEGTRSGLWLEFAKAIDVLRPRVVVIENVRGLLSAKAGRDTSRDMERGYSVVGTGLRAAGAVLGDLADLGYDAVWTTVAAASVGAPHKRERVFIVAHPAGDGWDTRRPESAGQQWRSDDAVGSGSDSRVDLLPTPSVADGEGGHLTRSGSRSGELLLPGVARAAALGELLPTPTTRDGKGGNPNRDGGPDLPTALALLPTPATADGSRGPDFARAGREGCGGDDLVTIAARASRSIGVEWGRYEPAIRRWEQITRVAPHPVEPNSKGNPRLAAAFPEWMMGWPDQWATGLVGQERSKKALRAAGHISRNEALRIIGNGVVPQQAYAALAYLVSVEAAA